MSETPAPGMDAETFDQFLEQLERYVRERLIPAEAEVIANDRIPDEIVAEMKEMGLFGLTVPEDFGGAGLNTTQYAKVVKTMAYAAPAYRSIFSINVGMFNSAIKNGGTDAQKAEWWPRIAAGEIACFGLTEPGSGSDSAAMATTARPDPDGNGWILNGTKRYITNAPHADVALIMARTEKDALPKNAHVSAFIVPMDTPGMSTSSPDKKMGQSGSHISDVMLDDVHVPGEALLGGQTGKGFRFAMMSLDNGRISVGAASTGYARRALDSALKYLMVKSANDIAVAIAQTVGGTTERFVAMMNAEAQRIGMISTRFVNPNGLPGEGQYSTARDLALLAVTLRREFPEYANYFNLEGFTVGTRSYENFNSLIGRFAGADGMKTGYICASGYNQVSSATVNGRTVVSVILGADSLVDRADESARLLNEALNTPAGGETLWTLAPYGPERDQVRDVSAEICSTEARKARQGERDEDGKLVFHSPLIKDRGRDPNYVQAPVGAAIGNGPASAAEAAILLGTSYIPLPNFRPAS